MKKLLYCSLFGLSLLLSSQYTFAQFSLSVGVTIRSAPPPLPVYSQPPCPVEGYLWTPGYWAYDEVNGYYWVPGIWIAPPSPGLLWTPGYWGFAGGVYGWHAGYWGPHVGFYGGINYGYGYGGAGFVGGEWHGGVFRYNTAITNVNTTVVHNVYVNRTVINNTTIINNNNNRPSFNGAGGIAARPTMAEQSAMRENHVQPTQAQFDHNHTASKDQNAFAMHNGGHPNAVAHLGGGVSRPASPMASSRPAPMPAAANHSQQAPHPHPQAMPHPQPMSHPQSMSHEHEHAHAERGEHHR